MVYAMQWINFFTALVSFLIDLTLVSVIIHAMVNVAMLYCMFRC